MLARTFAIFLLLLAGCSSPPNPPPAGWVKDECDLREPGFSAAVQPRDLFRRSGDDSARSVANHVVEATGDLVVTALQGTSSNGRNDVHSWQTREGFVEVYWTHDPDAWSADYTVSKTAAGEAQDAKDRNATAYAVLGALGIPDVGITWTQGNDSTTAERVAGGLRLPLLRATDHLMQAEQAQLVRRMVHADPDYDVSGLEFLGVEAARQAAQSVLDCHAAKGSPALRADVAAAQVTVFGSIPAYWFEVAPTGDSACGAADAGRLHVALDAGTGTVLSTDLACGSTG